MNKVSLLAASVALALVGCGGSDGGSTPPTAVGGIVVTAIDGYLQNAQIWVDQDKDLTNGCEVNTGVVTSEDGTAEIDKSKYAGMSVCIKAVEGQTIDSDRGLVSKNFALAAPSSEDNNVIINPMTNMVIEQMTSGLEQTEAEQNVVASIATSIEGADSAMIFGDYIKVETKEAKALKVIGETLVDNSDKSVETQLDISAAVAEDTSSKTEAELENYAPVVEFEGDKVTVVPNSRPVAEKIDPIDMTFGDAWVDLNVSNKFSDKESASLKYSMFEINGNDNGLTITQTGVISGTPEKAGEFLYQVFAEDEHGSLSYPANLKVTITTPNSAPTVEPSVELIVKGIFAEERFTQGQEILGAVYDVTGLFKDADGDTLTYTVEGEPTGVTVSLTANELMITGTPSAAGESIITLSATDSIHEQAAETTITLTVEEAPVPSFGFNEAELITLESEIKTKLGELTQNQPITPVTLETTLKDIFPAQNINIPVEYFAGMNTSNSDHQTSIDGIRVDVTDEGVLSLSGTPTEASENGVFYIAAGIYVDQADEVVSSMEQVTLPVVKADETTPPETEIGFTEAHFNNQLWRMGSFADKDGEVAYASLMNESGTLEWCWGSADGSMVQYQTNISDSMDLPMNTLDALDNKSGYLAHQAKDCWEVEIQQDGSLKDVVSSGDKPSTYTMLYQHSPVAGQYQIIVRIGDQELFWLDSTDTPFAQALPVATKIAAGKVEYDISVEAGNFVPELDGPEMSYFLGSYTFSENNRFHNVAINPTGFETEGSWERLTDSNRDEYAELQEESEDQKTRTRYINRDFGDFYIAVTWSKELDGSVSSAQYSLFGHDKTITESVFNQLPVAK